VADVDVDVDVLLRTATAAVEALPLVWVVVLGWCWLLVYAVERLGSGAAL